MPKVTIDIDLADLVQQLSALRIATPIENPDYGAVVKRYREASDLREKAVGKAIDEADKDYQEFSKGMQAAIKAIKEAQKKIDKVAEAVELAAKVIDLIGKVVAKLA
jgi:esterase/lipase